jgi:hypothetical protein
MPPDHPMSALGALAVVEDELRRPSANLWKIDLVLARLAYRTYRALTEVTLRRAGDINLLVDLIGGRPESALAVLLSGLTARSFGLALRCSLGEWRRLSFAAPPQILNDLLQLRDPTLLLRHSAAKLNVLLKNLVVSRHAGRILEHAVAEYKSPPSMLPVAGSCPTEGRGR